MAVLIVSIQKISHAETPFDAAQGRLRTRSKEFLIKKYSELCELCPSISLRVVRFSNHASAVK